MNVSGRVSAIWTSLTMGTVVFPRVGGLHLAVEFAVALDWRGELCPHGSGRDKPAAASMSMQMTGQPR
ncbi:hypothetical protein STHU_20530 [Allostella humosa]|nr:hypothetical protein STHU_20530 [Stella humosa]